MTADEVLENQLKSRTRFRRLVHVASCDSTQALASAPTTTASDSPADAVFWADHQTAGRGRQERKWNDEPGLDLAVTFRIEARLPEPLALPAALPVAVLQAAEAAAGQRLSIKWPNDVYSDGRKLSGVLIDRDSRWPDVYRIGVGLNVNRTRFPRELEPTATSLALISGRLSDRRALLLALSERVDRMISALLEGRYDDLEALFRERIGLLGERVTVQAASESMGTLTAIDFERLVLDGTRSVPLAIVRALRRAPA